jgi:hypothetical protein
MQAGDYSACTNQDGEQSSAQTVEGPPERAFAVATENDQKLTVALPEQLLLPALQTL